MFPEVPGPIATPAAASCVSPDMASGTPPLDQQAFAGSDSELSQAQVSQNEEEQALEIHEVIELQAFSERKAWIEDKIKFLEALPPIEVFVGLDAIRTSAEDIPGLPTREQLQEWLAEHDRIEKETEIFDSGELKKLRALTKAATQRHLSPEDTDVIELTLTTIYELDKLLHLLRDRSENLDLLGIRLTWEEQRRAAWSDRQKILADIENFLTTRARWSPSIYEFMVKSEEKPSNRRGSVASMASDTSVTSNTGFSRSARFKLAEILSRDSAQVAGRVSSLRHGKVAAAGKALDKLIDNSRRADKGINEMEHVGKFVMNIVTQWRKADEIYVETMKDENAAQNLLEEIETSKLYHPTFRQSTSFLSRAETLVKRLAPTEAISQILSSELASTSNLVAKVDSLAKEYRVGYEAVKDVESLSRSADKLMEIFNSAIDRLENGVTACDGDGTPPSLISEDCLHPTAHSVFITFLPSITQEVEQSCTRADHLLRAFRVALLNAERPGIDQTFKDNATAQIEALVAVRDKAAAICADVNTRLGRLRVARRVWSIMDGVLNELEDTRSEVADLMERERWKQTNQSAEPLTPETPPQDVLPTPSVSSSDIVGRLEVVYQTLTNDVMHPLATLSGMLEKPLDEFLSRTSEGLFGHLDNVKQMFVLLDAIRSQYAAMISFQDSVHELQVRVEDLKIHYDATIQEILNDQLCGESLGNAQDQLKDESNVLRSTADAFTNTVAQRIPFLSQHVSDQRNAPILVRKRFSSAGNIKLISFDVPAAIEPPFTLRSLDDAVRGDSNLLVMRLLGDVQSLEQKTGHLRLACMAKDADSELALVADDLRGVTEELGSLRTLLDSISRADEKLTPLQDLSEELDRHSSQHRSRLSRRLSLIRESLRQMESVPCSHDHRIYETLIMSRRREVDNLEVKLSTWADNAAMLRGKLSVSLTAEAKRIEAAKLREEQEAEERRRRVELERREAEAKAKEEQERRDAEVKAKEEQECREAEAKAKEEHERKEAEAKAKEEQERREAEAKAKEEQERREAEAKVKQEQERKEAEARVREEEERREAEAKVKQEQERKEAEARAREEEERKKAERLRIEKELRDEQQAREERLKAEQQQAEMERQARERERLEAEAQIKAGIQLQETEYQKRDESQLFEDVFGLRIAPSPSPTKTHQRGDLLDKVVSLRKRLRSIGINEVAHPAANSNSSNHLPTLEQYGKMNALFASIVSELSKLAALPSSMSSPAADMELRSANSEVEASTELMQRIRQLADLSDVAHRCDMALSDLLEHIDSYPSPPAGPLSSTHVSTSRLPPEEQLAARLAFTKRIVTQVAAYIESVKDDARASSEYRRVQQTWVELEEMAHDRICGKKSRPASVLSSGRNSSASGISSGATGHTRKASGYSNLSVRGSANGRFLAPAHPSPRRVASGDLQTRPRPSSKLSMLSTASMSRSVSLAGPIATPSSSSSLHGSTFASRQRTASLSGNATPNTPTKQPPVPTRPRAQTRSRASPTPSEASVVARSTASHSRSSSSMSTWARAPRQSFPTSNKVQTPPKKTQPQTRKTYVANPKNKLDVAVGDVVNKLPVNINIEVVADTWKDQSGKYWIGDQEPKLCFCRILRSQTVMVRVGGGWQELSKFIKDHFADVFRIIPPESPPKFGSPRFGSREEKWISSATLLEAPEIVTTPPPCTPEPRGPFLPSFTISTPGAHSPHSVKSTPSSGSPLAPLQFLRRADPDAMRPVTPSKPHRPRKSIPNTPARHNLWRP
ncbi:uncharacterized protein F5891DRAFT_1001838 [Suillus fuscotomentosus]|uniref:GAR domain-containing protein n=1 Tax=Suillus fuscotomentosus TaxID=1912939 RepID=A0AAD4HST0_9AGAM|nr:uncharacterized protein F5891DRAFT_1001838 [Suillus fuscotomentosus]KAG1907452.1 hypothetical protein F5891DRAFT_1001838 [Suillus fuscotomentosus]